MVISNGDKTKELTLYPTAQPLLDIEEPTWVDSDLEDSIHVLTIGQAPYFEEPTNQTILENFF